MADLLDRIAARCHLECGFPEDYIWFEEPIILPPDADAREIQIEEDKPRQRAPRVARVLQRDPYDGTYKVDMGFRVTTINNSYVEAAVPLSVGVEESILRIILPKPEKTEVKIQTTDLPERVKAQESAFLHGVLEQVHKSMQKFLTGAKRARIGFHQEGGEPI